MHDTELWQVLATIGAVGTTGSVILLVIRVWNGIPKFMEQWLALRAAKAAEKAADWSRMRDLLNDQGNILKGQGNEITRLGEEVKRSREAERNCEEELADKERRIATLEGLNMGRGQARQEAAIIESAKRIVDDK